MQWHLVQVTKLGDWMCMPVSPCVPADHKIKGAGVMLVVPPGTHAVPLLQAAAKNAFKGLSVPTLKKLIAHLEVNLDSGMPQLEAELCQVLVRFCLPDLADEEVAAIVATRTMRNGSKFHSYLTEANLEASHDVLEEEVVKGARDQLRKDVVSKACQDLRQGSKPDRKVRAPTKPQPLQGDSWTQAEAKRFLPSAAGATIVKDVVWHHRWVVKYPRPQPPYSTSMTFAKAGSERAALIHCLSWVWDLHTQETGQQCPWALGA